MEEIGRRLRETQTELHVNRNLSRPGFDEETRAFQQKRLQILAGTLAIVTAVLLAAFIAANATSHDSDPLGRVVIYTLFEFPNALVTGLVVVSGGLWWLLRSRQLPPPALTAAWIPAVSSDFPSPFAPKSLIDGPPGTSDAAGASIFAILNNSADELETNRHNETIPAKIARTILATSFSLLNY